MRIVRLEVTPIALPFRERYRTASGELDARSMAIVRLHTDSDIVGLGEAVPLSLRGGASLPQVVSELSACNPVLAGTDTSAAAGRDPTATREWIWSQLARCRRERIGAPALAAIDIALHDLAGKLSGMPVWRLLGATGVRRIACNATLDAGEPDQIGALANSQMRAGFATFKVKVGTGDDEARVEAIRRNVGDSSHLRIDANGAWAPEEAVATLHRLQTYGIELAEQPCADLAGLASVRGRTPIPLVADESVATPEEAEQAVAAGACDAATIKLAKVGGPLEALRLAAVIPAYLSSALDGPIGIAAAIHVAQALPRAGFASRFAHGLATLEMFATTYAPHDGLYGPAVVPPRAPGLGIELDESRLQEFRIR